MCSLAALGVPHWPTVQCFSSYPSCCGQAPGAEPATLHFCPLTVPLPSVQGRLLQFLLLLISLFGGLVGTTEGGQVGLDRGSTHRSVYIWKNRNSGLFMM